jgi:hypothetical protein
MNSVLIGRVLAQLVANSVFMLGLDCVSLSFVWCFYTAGLAVQAAADECDCSRGNHAVGWLHSQIHTRFDHGRGARQEMNWAPRR